MSVIMNLALFPVDKGESLSGSVAKVVDVIKASSLPYVLGPMGTCIEGEWDDVVAVFDRCFRVLAEDSGRIYIAMTADYRRDRKDGLEEKVRSVTEKLKG